MKQCIFLITLLFVFACNKPLSRYNEITRIEIATGGCFGTCQLTAVSIDSSLLYQYYGGGTFFISDYGDISHGELKGYYSGRISKPFWDTLNIKLEQIKYKQLDTAYQHTLDDESLEIIIHYDNKVKHIKAQAASLSKNVADVFYYIIKSYKTVKPKHVNDAIRFETTIQKPRIPNVRKVKFPPPTKEQLKN